MRNRDIINKLIWDVFDLGMDLAISLQSLDPNVPRIMREDGISEGEAERIVYGMSREDYLLHAKGKLVARYMEQSVDGFPQARPTHQGNPNPSDGLQTVLPNGPQDQNKGG